MLAETQLEQRSRLGLALFSLGRLAEDVGLQPSPAQTVNSLVAGLKDPFLFVVAGEVNAGKSMLLNALFGEEFCQTSPLPSTDRIHYFRHGFTHREAELAPMLHEIKLPRAFLHDFHIVDTPGVNSVAAGHEIVTEQFLPRADAVLFVLPVTNPWGAKCWEFLRRIHVDLEKRIVLVLQQIDLRTEAEVIAITEHVKICARRWLGRELQVFPVSARKAFLSRTSGVGKEELLAESRFLTLENHLSNLLIEDGHRMDRLGNTLRMGRIILSQINERLNDKAAKLAKLGDVLRSVGKDVQDQKSTTWEGCLKSLKTLDKRVQKAGDVCQEKFAAQIAPWPNIISAAPFDAVDETLKQWDTATRSAISGHVHDVDNLVKTDFSQLWRKTRSPVGNAIGEKLPQESSVKTEPKSLLQDQEEILKGLNSIPSWKQALAPLFKRRRQQVLGCIIGCALGIILILAGAFTQLLLLLIPGILLVFALPMLAVKLQKKSTKAILLKLAECCQTDQKRIRQKSDIALQKWLQKSYQQFSVNFKPLLDRCERSRVDQESWLKEAEAMRTTFEDLAKSMGRS